MAHATITPIAVINAHLEPKHREVQTENLVNRSGPETIKVDLSATSLTTLTVILAVFTMLLCG